MDTTAPERLKPSSPRGIGFLFFRELQSAFLSLVLVAGSVFLIGCETSKTKTPSNDTVPSATSSGSVTNEAPVPTTTSPKRPIERRLQSRPTVVQNASPSNDSKSVASTAPSKGAEKLMPARVPGSSGTNNGPRAASASPPPNVSSPTGGETASVPPAVESLIVKGTPRQYHPQGVSKGVWFGLFLFAAALLLLGARVYVARQDKMFAEDDGDIRLPPEFKMREPTNISR